MMRILVVFIGLAVAATAQHSYDLVIRGGTVHDGTGGPCRVADVAIRGDVIAAIGEIPTGSAPHEIDATGLVICPGFIDLHNHSDNPILKDRLRRNLAYLTQGCTTVVTGNCGSGHVDVGAFFEKLEKRGTGTNIIQNR